MSHRKKHIGHYVYISVYYICMPICIHIYVYNGLDYIYVYICVYLYIYLPTYRTKIHEMILITWADLMYWIYSALFTLFKKYCSYSIK